jgi:hypothetical protein
VGGGCAGGKTVLIIEKKVIPITARTISKIPLFVIRIKELVLNVYILLIAKVRERRA